MQHAIAKQFVLLDNFYANAKVSASGHEWTTAAYCTDFVEKTWPLNVSAANRSKKSAIPAKATIRWRFRPSDYIWDRCKEASVSYRSYGEFIENGAEAGRAIAHENQVARRPLRSEISSAGISIIPTPSGPTVSSKNCTATKNRATCHSSSSCDFQTTTRLARSRQTDADARWSRKTIWRSAGSSRESAIANSGTRRPSSSSKTMPKTAPTTSTPIARSALVISPYCRRGVVDSTLYSTTSMLRTMELILGLKPMSQFDAAAAPMYESFQPKLDLEPYTHVPAEVRLTAVNERGAWGAEASAKFDFTHEDAADENVFNQVIWHSVRGADIPMPPPVHAAFVRTHPPAAGDDDD